MPDPMQQIADAVDATRHMQQLGADMAQLTAVVQSNLAEQQRLNSRMEAQVQMLSSGLQESRERLIVVEQQAGQVEPLRQEICVLRADFTGLKTTMAKYVGIIVGVGTVASMGLSVLLHFWK